MSTPSETATPGTVIAGRYEIERLIARGGMAAVYLANQRNLRRKVALKILAPPNDAADRSTFEERFRLEAETLASFDHPHIVTLYDYGEVDEPSQLVHQGRYFLAMEYVAGPRLTDLLRDGPLSAPSAIRLMGQVCRALRYAHRRGVVHRDLKPSNLLVKYDDDGDAQIKVVDFGLVKLKDEDQSITRAGMILGSPHCMAPEQIRGEAIDHRADIYAVGILLFRSIMGAYPFHGNTSAATMISHLNDPIPSFRDQAPDVPIPPGLEDVVRRCLAKEPDARFPDMVSLFQALRSTVSVPLLDDGPPSQSMASSPSLDPVAAAIAVTEDPPPSEPTLAAVATRRNLAGIGIVSVAVMLLTSAAALAAGLALALGTWWPSPAEAPPASVPAPIAPVSDPEPAPEPKATSAGQDVEANAPAAPSPPPASPPPPTAQPKPTPAAEPEPEPEPEPAVAPEPEPEAEAPEGYMGMPDDLFGDGAPE